MKKSAQTGVTLIELMIVIALIGVMATMGIPALQEFIANSRLRSEVNDIVVALHRARNEAIEIRSQRGVHVTAELAAGNRVERFIVWADGPTAKNPGGNADGVIDGGDINTSLEVLQVAEIDSTVNVTLPGYDATVDLSDTVGIANNMDGRTLSFRADGSLRVNANFVNISLTDSRPGRGRCLLIRMTGQVSLRDNSAPCSP